MGINQLLPFLEKSTRKCHISEFKGKTVAIDSYCWLHKAARGCAVQLEKGEKTTTYVDYCMKYIQLLLAFHIKPIMVFDGRHLPAKAKTEEKRRDAKKTARKQAMELLRLGNTAEAYKYFCQCVDVTPEMASQLIKECRKLQVDCIVAPYEADAQLAFFSLKGVADLIISEDSDLLLFGCKKVFYKMDFTGCGQLVDAEKINLSMKLRPDQFNFDKFLEMCVLSGCDYLDSLPGIGLRKALRFLSLTLETDPQIYLDRIPRYLNMKNLVVPQEYKTQFQIALATFKHQIVFNPFDKCLEPLNPNEGQEQYCVNAGEVFDEKLGYQLALGNLNPFTMAAIDNWQPEESVVNDFSIWSPRFIKYHGPTTKSKPTSTISKATFADLDKIYMEHDQQILKELQFYKTSGLKTAETDSLGPQSSTSSQQPTTSSSPQSSSSSQLSTFSPQPSTSSARPSTSSPLDLTTKRREATEGRMSPVLGSNPFMKNKLSKFPTSAPASSQPVMSRFFQTKEAPKSPQPGPSKLAEEFSESYFDSDEEPPRVECECNLAVEEDTVLVFENADPPFLHSVENLLMTHTGVKRKYGSSAKNKRSKPEKTKRAKSTKGQMNIHDMIKNMKKD